MRKFEITSTVYSLTVTLSCHVMITVNDFIILIRIVLNRWRYQGVKELDGYDWWGLLATYSGAGSVESLSLVKEETSAKLRELKESIWIRRGTRYVALDFTLYNANVNLFCVVK